MLSGLKWQPKETLVIDCDTTGSLRSWKTQRTESLLTKDKNFSFFYKARFANWSQHLPASGLLCLAKFLSQLECYQIFPLEAFYLALSSFVNVLVLLLRTTEMHQTQLRFCQDGACSYCWDFWPHCASSFCASWTETAAQSRNTPVGTRYCKVTLEEPSKVRQRFR